MLPEQEASNIVMQYVFKGGEVAIKLAGAAAKNLALLLFALLQQKNRTKGQVWVKTMAQQGTALMSFPLPSDKLKLFSDLAKQRGIMYAVIQGKGEGSPAVDILARQQDAALLKDIFEKLNLGAVPVAATAEPAPITPEERVTLEQQGNKTAIDHDLNELLKAEGIERSNPTISERNGFPFAKDLSATHKQSQPRPSVRSWYKEYAKKPAQQHTQPTKSKKPSVSKAIPNPVIKTK